MDKVFGDYFAFACRSAVLVGDYLLASEHRHRAVCTLPDVE